MGREVWCHPNVLREHAGFITHTHTALHSRPLPQSRCSSVLRWTVRKTALHILIGQYNPVFELRIISLVSIRRTFVANSTSPSMGQARCCSLSACDITRTVCLGHAQQGFEATMVDLGRRKTNHAAYWLTAIAFASLVTKVWPLLLFFNPLSVCAILNKRATVGAKLVSGTICHDIQGTLRHGQCSGTRRERSRRCARPQASSSMTRVPLPAEGRTIQQKDGAPCRFRTPLNRCYMR